jgi:hypothetical protein
MAADNDFALDYLSDCLQDAVLGQTGAVRPANLVRSLPGDLRVSVGLIRKHLEADDRFVEVDGRYDIAERDSLDGRPFGGVLTAIVRSYGRPMPVALLARTLSRIRRGTPSDARGLVGEYLAGSDDLVVLDDRVILADWLLVMGGQSEDEMLFYNDLQDDEDLRELWASCRRRDLRKRGPIATARRILESFGRPIGARPLAFLTWVHHPQIFDPVEFMSELLGDDTVVFIHGPVCITAHQRAAGLRHLRKLSEKAAGKDEVMADADLAAILAEEPPEDADAWLESEDRENILAVVGAARVPIGINEIIADILEMKPNARKYKSAAHALQNLLAGDDTFVRTSTGHYLAAGTVPGWISEVPDELVPEPTAAEEDVLLAAEGLHKSLASAVVDPVYDDILSGLPSEPEGEDLADDHTVLPLLYHHYLAGTMYVRPLDRALFAGDSAISVLTFRHGDADTLSVWLNRDLWLIFGLGSWYRGRVHPAGSLISIRAGRSPGEFLLEYSGGRDEAIAVDDERLAVLEERRERVATRPTSAFDLLVEIVSEHRSGIRFDALWSQVNVVRRTTRWQIASILSYHNCFEYVGGKTQGWKFVSDLINDGGPEELHEFLVSALDDEQGRLA